MNEARQQGYTDAWLVDGTWVGLDLGQRIIGAHASDPEWLEGVDGHKRRIRVRASAIVRVLENRQDAES